MAALYTLDTRRLRTIQRLQKAGMLYLAGFAFMPAPIVLLARFVPGGDKQRFGKLGSMNHKVLIVVAAATPRARAKRGW